MTLKYVTVVQIAFVRYYEDMNNETVTRFYRATRGRESC